MNNSKLYFVTLFFSLCVYVTKAQNHNNGEPMNSFYNISYKMDLDKAKPLIYELLGSPDKESLDDNMYYIWYENKEFFEITWSDIVFRFEKEDNIFHLEECNLTFFTSNPDDVVERHKESIENEFNIKLQKKILGGSILRDMIIYEGGNNPLNPSKPFIWFITQRYDIVRITFFPEYSVDEFKKEINKKTLMM